MKKFFILIFFLTCSLNSNAHIAHYNKFNKIEMEILRSEEHTSELQDTFGIFFNFQEHFFNKVLLLKLKSIIVNSL